MRKPWHTPAWRKKREEFLKGKSCEWCGSLENLAIHHKRSFNGLQEYKRISSIFLSKYFLNGKNENERQKLLERAKEGVIPRYYDACPSCGYSLQVRKIKTPKYRCYRCKIDTDNPIKKLHTSTISYVNKKFYSLFFKLHREEVAKLFADEKKKADQEYMAFKDVLVLCKKCHYAIGKGLVLCKICRQRYHKPRYGMCWECFKKTEKGQKVAKENELLPYIHPWCGKEFQIMRKWWDIEAEPQMCCIENCDPYGCEFADKHLHDNDD